MAGQFPWGEGGEPKESRRGMMGVSFRIGAALVAAGSLAVSGCNDGTEPEPFETGSVEFEWALEGAPSATIWTASGSCGTIGFDLGSATCAVGSNEGGYWAVLGVIANEDDTYDTVTVVHPPGEGDCEAEFDGVSTTCTVEFVRSRVDFPEDPVATYVMTSGTITFAVEETETGPRLVGTFAGVAEDFSSLELDPITVTGGGFDVDFVQ
mgnify:CR=1 FL=1